MRCLHLQSKSKEIRSTTAARTLLVTSQPAISSSGKQQTGSSTFGGCCSISHSFISNAFCHNSTHYSSQSQSTVQIMEGELGFLSLFFGPDHLCTMSCSKTQPPDFPPKGSGHFISNFLLSAGILAQYKTFHVSFKKYLYL